MHVELIRTTGTGQVPAGTVTLKDSKIVYSGVDADLLATMREGVRIGASLVLPKHGAKFLRALPYLFNGSYLRARVVP